MAQFNLAHTPLGESLTILVDGSLRTADESHPNYAEIRDAVVNGDPSDADLLDLLDVAGALNRKFQKVSERVSVAGHSVLFDNEPVDNSLTRTILRHSREGVNFGPLVAFMENVMLNPQPHSREQLYEWLRDRDFTITDDGCFIAYKGVEASGLSVYSGGAIVDGEQVDGKVPNEVGSVIEMPRGRVQHNPSVGCAPGLHVATFDYARSWGEKVLTVKVNPRDVVSVPTDSNAAKVRTCRYTVLEVTDVPSDRVLFDWADEDGWDEVDEDYFDHNEIVDVWNVSSDTRPGVFYTLTEYADGRIECECPAATYRQEACKHERRAEVR